MGGAVHQGVTEEGGSYCLFYWVMMGEPEGELGSEGLCSNAGQQT